MKAVTWQGVGDIRLSDVPEPKLREPTDAIVSITTSAICGTDLHMIRGTLPGMEPGTVLGHEAVGVVLETGTAVRNFRPGDRVVVGSTIGCGYCSYCRAGYYAQCDNANPGGKRAGTSFFGGPASTGSVDGLQAERARIPYAAVTMVPLPDSVDDAAAIPISDILPTGWFGAELAEVGDGDTVAVFGAGPVGLCAVVSAYLQGAGRVIVVDGHTDRLDQARSVHAETVNYEAEDPVETILDLTGGVGVDRVIDAVGVDAQRPQRGPAAPDSDTARQQDAQTERVAPQTSPRGDTWVPGNAPAQALEWALGAIAKAGTLGIIGVYPPTMQEFPLGQMMNRNLTVQAGNCNHRRYLPKLVELTATGAIDLAPLLTQHEPLTDVIAAYEQFDRRDPGWLKVALAPSAG